MGKIKEKKKKQQEFEYFNFNNKIIEQLLVQISPNNRARCKECEKLITKGSLRFKLYGTYSHIIWKGKQHSVTYSYYYCWKCYEKQLQMAGTLIKLAQKDYKKWLKKNPEAIKNFEETNKSLEVLDKL